MAYRRAIYPWPPLTRARRRSVISGDANSWSPGAMESPRLRSSLTAAARLWSLWVKRKSSISVSSSSHSEICSLSVRSPLLAIALTGKQGGRLPRPQPKRNYIRCDRRGIKLQIRDPRRSACSPCSPSAACFPLIEQHERRSGNRASVQSRNRSAQA